MRVSPAACAALVAAAAGAAVAAGLLLAAGPVAAAPPPHRHCVTWLLAAARGDQLSVCADYARTENRVRLRGLEASFTSGRGYALPFFLVTFRDPRTGHTDGWFKTPPAQGNAITRTSTRWLTPATGHGTFSFAPGEIAVVTLRASNAITNTLYTVTQARFALTKPRSACPNPGTTGNGKPAC